VSDRLEELLTRLEELVDVLERLDDSAVRDQVFELLDGVDTLHRFALDRLVAELEVRGVAPEQLRDSHPAIAWLFEAYGLGLDQREASHLALEAIRPFVHSHGGEVEVLDVTDGVVHVRLAGACSGCTSSDVTLTEGVEEALREGLSGFVRVTLEEDDAPPHPPPGPTLLQLQSGPPEGFP
jgi:Fe-S cluster biogenesis protein NfuA